MKTEKKQTEMQRHLRIADMAEQSKPCEKAEQYGIQCLSDAELLAVVLRSGTRSENVIDLAHRLLNLDPQHPGLTGLNYLSLKELKKLPGIGSVKAVQVKAVAELSRRMAREVTRGSVSLNSPETIADHFREDMRYLTRERVYAVFFDTSGKLIREAQISEGTVNRALISPREVFVEALSCGAVSFVLLHNHPSGDCTPSREDRYVTVHLRELGEMMGIKLLDHIIIGGSEHVSFAELGIFDNEIEDI